MPRSVMTTPLFLLVVALIALPVLAGALYGVLGVVVALLVEMFFYWYTNGGFA